MQLSRSYSKAAAATGAVGGAVGGGGGVGIATTVWLQADMWRDFGLTVFRAVQRILNFLVMICVNINSHRQSLGITMRRRWRKMAARWVAAAEAVGVPVAEEVASVGAAAAGMAAVGEEVVAGGGGGGGGGGGRRRREAAGMAEAEGGRMRREAEAEAAEDAAEAAGDRGGGEGQGRSNGHTVHLRNSHSNGLDNGVGVAVNHEKFE